MGRYWKQPTGKKSPRVRAKNRALKYWSLIIRNRYPICQFCGKRETKEAHHIIPRRSGIKQHWFDLHNGIGLCKHCHSSMAHSVDVYDQIEFLEFVKDWLKKKNLDFDMMRNISLRKQHKMSEFEIDVFAKALLRVWNLEKPKDVK